MQSWQFGSAIVVGMILVISATGCAPQGVPVAGGTAPQNIVTDLDRPMSSERWKIYRPSGDMPIAAGIVDPADEISLSVYCDDRLHPLSILITAVGRPRFEQPDIALVFEDGSAIDSFWIPASTERSWGFGIVSGQPGFWTAIADLKRHDSIEATFSEAGQQWHYRFTLSDAEEEIAYVEQQCAATL